MLRETYSGHTNIPTQLIKNNQHHFLIQSQVGKQIPTSNMNQNESNILDSSKASQHQTWLKDPILDSSLMPPGRCFKNAFPLQLHAVEHAPAQRAPGPSIGPVQLAQQPAGRIRATPGKRAETSGWNGVRLLSLEMVSGLISFHVNYIIMINNVCDWVDDNEI